MSTWEEVLIEAHPKQIYIINTPSGEVAIQVSTNGTFIIGEDSRGAESIVLLANPKDAAGLQG